MNHFFLGLILFFISAVASADVVNVEDLNQKLQQRGAGWTAKQTWLNQLTKAEAKKLMGLRENIGSEVEFEIEQTMTSRLPETVDWRNKENQNWISPIANQANCGSCVAFAAIGVLESQLNISSVLPNLNMRLSTQNLFACGGGYCDRGWYPSAAASYLMKKGVVDEACHPYVSGATGKDVKCTASCADTNKRLFKISGFSTPSRGATNIAAVKQALQKGPLMTTLTVYADFMVYAGGVYKHTTGEQMGGHAVSIVGYDDKEQAFIIRNSWGKEWGEDGFGKVAYSDLSGIGDSTWGFQTPSVVGAVALQYPRDYDYITGQVNFSAQSTFPKTQMMTATVFNKSGQAIWNANCENSNCEFSFDSTGFAEERYEIQITAFDDLGQSIATSTRQFFHIVNQPPTLGVSMTPQGTTYEKVFNGRVVFDVKTKSSSVPLSQIQFHYKNSEGTEKTKSAEVVLDSMSLGWRTNLLPNGTYEIWLSGAVKSNGMEVIESTPIYKVQVKN
ncbi:MAG: C1 family peptidase [Pseudobdellovibrionaceae bacterium]